MGTISLLSKLSLYNYKELASSRSRNTSIIFQKNESRIPFLVCVAASKTLHHHFQVMDPWWSHRLQPLHSPRVHRVTFLWCTWCLLDFAPGHNFHPGHQRIGLGFHGSLSLASGFNTSGSLSNSVRLVQCPFPRIPPVFPPARAPQHLRVQCATPSMSIFSVMPLSPQNSRHLWGTQGSLQHWSIRPSYGHIWLSFDGLIRGVTILYTIP